MTGVRVHDFKLMNFVWFLAGYTNGRAYATGLCPSSVVLICNVYVLWLNGAP